LGASVGNVVTLLSKDFLRLVGIASVIAFPLAYWMMHKWLQDFAYRISVSWWIFIACWIISIGHRDVDSKFSSNQSRHHESGEEFEN
jgi:putative ABC transport system permease protein